MAKKAQDLQAKLKDADPEIRAYVAELERRNGKLQAENVDRKNRIKALETGKGLPDLGDAIRRARERSQAGLVGRAGDLLKRFQAPTPEQIKAHIRELEEKLGIPPEKRSQF